MAHNYIDVPVLVCKLLAKGTCTTGGIVESGGDLTGFQDATHDTSASGIVAMEPGVAGTYFSAMVFGTAIMSTADSIKAGKDVEWSATGTVDSVADSDKKNIGTLIDGAAAAVTRSVDAGTGVRVLFNGTGKAAGTW